MISTRAAQEKILESVYPSGLKKIPVAEADGFVVAKEIISPLDLPPFNNSAMDGYAIAGQNFNTDQKFKVTGETQAGKFSSRKLKSGEAIRIFTGAAIPQGADSVVMQEKTEVRENLLTVFDEIKPGINIRLKGSQIKKGEVALNKGTVLSPAAVGFLSSMGLKTIPVYKKPSVTIIVTGNELQQPGTKLLPGNIFESNGLMLESALKKFGITEIKQVHVRDDEKKTIRALKEALRNSDFVLFSGGISVGDYDFARKAVKAEKVNEVFYKVKQKPGKPLYFGIKNKKYIFGLPGNPASVLTCFYEYVLPAIRKFSGFTDCMLPSLSLPLTKEISKKPGLTHFLKATTDFKSVTPLTGQESYILKSFADANCLIVCPEESTLLPEGMHVEVHLI